MNCLYKQTYASVIYMSTCEVQGNLCNGQINYNRPRAQLASTLTAPLVTVGLVNDLLILNKPNSWLDDPKFWHSYVVFILINLKPVWTCSVIGYSSCLLTHMKIFLFIQFFSSLKKKNTTYFDNIILVNIQNM